MRQQGLSPAARFGAAIVAVVAAGTLSLRLHLRMLESESLSAALSFLTQYFTILTNAMTLILMIAVAIGLNVSARIVRAIIISIVCVGLLYHTLLAHLVSLSGLALWADHGTHTFVPILSGLWWLFLAPHPRLGLGEIAFWLAWPLAYCAYILVRASFSGFYPYPFLNVPEIGWTALAINVVGMLIGFVIVGLVLTFVSRLTQGATKRIG